MKRLIGIALLGLIGTSVTAQNSSVDASNKQNVDAIQKREFLTNAK